MEHKVFNCFLVHVNRMHFYEKELSESSGERYLFTLSREYMTIVDALTQQMTKKPKTVMKAANTPPLSANNLEVIEANNLESNEARTALDIQLALSSYCQVRRANLHSLLTWLFDENLRRSFRNVCCVSQWYSWVYKRTSPTIKAYDEALKLGEQYI